MKVATRTVNAEEKIQTGTGKAAKNDFIKLTNWFLFCSLVILQFFISSSFLKIIIIIK